MLDSHSGFYTLFIASSSASSAVFQSLVCIMHIFSKNRVQTCSLCLCIGFLHCIGTARAARAEHACLLRAINGMTEIAMSPVGCILPRSLPTGHKLSESTKTAGRPHRRSSSVKLTAVFVCCAPFTHQPPLMASCHMHFGQHQRLKHIMDVVGHAFSRRTESRNMRKDSACHLLSLQCSCFFVLGHSLPGELCALSKGGRTRQALSLLIQLSRLRSQLSLFASKLVDLCIVQFDRQPD